MTHETKPDSSMDDVSNPPRTRDAQMPDACPAPRHGTATAYQVDRCRCPDAQEAQRLYRKRLRVAHHRGEAVRVPVIGLQRRIEALMVMGWPRHEISRRMGYSPHSNMWLGHRSGVRRTTIAKVKAVYDELSMIPGPSRWTRSHAVSRGYAPPLAWDDDTIDLPGARPRISPQPQPFGVDEIAVTEAMTGRPVRLTKAEKREVAIRLSRLGLSAAEIADRMHTNRDAAQKLVSRGKAAA